MKSLVKSLWIYCILFFCQLHATDYLPWAGPTLEFIWKEDFRYQHYDYKKISSDDLFLNLSLSNAYQDIDVELEITQARTNKQHGTPDQLKITGRKVFLDDVLDDFATVTAGISLIQAFRPSVDDRSSFHHGYNEAEFFISIGKELTFSDNWESRAWGVVGIGTAIDRGSPWFHFESAYEKRFRDKHEFHLGFTSLIGLGNNRLKLHHFHGYGPVAHRSVDLNVKYTYLIDYFGHASLAFDQRVYAHNFPTYARSITLELMYSFGLSLGL